MPGEPVREMLIEAVEKRFGAVEAVPTDHRLQFLSDNGSAYIAYETRHIARSLGLTPVNTPVCSPQSNGMAESFVNTFKRASVSRMDLTDAMTFKRPRFVDVDRCVGHTGRVAFKLGRWLCRRAGCAGELDARVSGLALSI